MSIVLLVAKDRTVGTAIADRVEEAGHELLWCPGPKAPDLVCHASRGVCPLSAGADVAIVDGWLESDSHHKGMPSWQLALYYRNQGVGVVALAGPNGFPATVRDRFVEVLPRDAAPDAVLAAVERLGPADPHRRRLKVESRT